MDAGSSPAISTILRGVYSNMNIKTIFEYAIIVSKKLPGLTLAHAFVLAKSAGVQFRINTFDHVKQTSATTPGYVTINVDVKNGIVKKCWVTPCDL